VSYCTDNWSPYRDLIPKRKHTISKEQTCVVESKNSQIRTYGSVFKRKTKCTSKIMPMIYNQMLMVVNKINEIAMKNLKKKVQSF
jgi:IS1 family transposase